MAAQASVGLVLGAAIWAHPLRSRIATALASLCRLPQVIAPVDADFLTARTRFHLWAAPCEARAQVRRGAGDHRERPQSQDGHGRRCGRRRTGTVVRHGTSSRTATSELAAAHLALFGLLIGLHWPLRRAGGRSRGVGRGGDAPAPAMVRRGRRPVRPRYRAGRPSCAGSSWKGENRQRRRGAYTYQAALFTKLRAHETVPHLFRGLPELLGLPVLRALLRAVHRPAMAVLSRRLHAAAAHLASPGCVARPPRGRASRAADRHGVDRHRRRPADPADGAREPAGLAAGVVVLGDTMFINGASCAIPTSDVAALFAWAIEAPLPGRAARASAPRPATLGARPRRDVGPSPRDRVRRTAPPSASASSPASP